MPDVHTTAVTRSFPLCDGAPIAGTPADCRCTHTGYALPAQRKENKGRNSSIRLSKATVAIIGSTDHVFTSFVWQHHVSGGARFLIEEIVLLRCSVLFVRVLHLYCLFSPQFRTQPGQQLTALILSSVQTCAHIRIGHTFATQTKA